MANKKSTFYHIRNKTVGINQEIAGKILGITTEEVHLYDKLGAPAMAESLLLLWDKKHIGHNEWNGWYFSRGCLCKGKERWRPDNIMSDRKFRLSLESESLLLLSQFKTS